MAQTKIRASKQFYVDDNLDFNAKKITNLAAPVDNGDAATKAYVDGILAASDALVYKGAIDCSSNPNYPAANAGDFYKISVAGKIGGASGISVVAGDNIICTVDSSATGAQATVGANWNVIHGGSEGNLIGPGSSTDNAIPRFDGLGGTTLQNSLVTIDDNGSVNIPSGQSYKINGAALNQDNIGDGTTYKQYSATDKSKLAGIETGADVTDAGNVGSAIHGSTAKTTMHDDDTLAMIDSEASNVLKKLSWAYVKSILKTYFDTLYSASGHTHASYLSASNFVVREAPTGTKNGSNKVFTLAFTPTSGTEMIFVNGMLQNAGSGNDYTISTNQITFEVAPISSDVILVSYMK